MSIHFPEDPKIVTFLQAQSLIKRARARGKTIVLAQGVFDVIHVGHSAFLKDAKRNGDLLFVGLESDESVKFNKGSSRPFNPIEERLQLIADLECVDYVFSFEDTVSYSVSAAEELHVQRLKQLMPSKVALPLDDPWFSVRSERAKRLGIEPVIARSRWREYSTTKLLSYIAGSK